MERKMVTIREVAEILPMEGSDFLEIAVVDGWQCVVSKNDGFKAGDIGVYFEVDSFILQPEDPRFQFLRRNSYRKLEDGTEGYKLKTIKLRGYISQGLLMPLTIFPEIGNVSIGDDVSELLKVIKWDPPVPVQLRGITRGNFPNFIRKTDEDRIQNNPKYFQLYQGKEFEITEKIDGSSMTVYKNGEDFGICSRNLNIKVDDMSNGFVQIATELNLQYVLNELSMNIALQGELAGEGIQKNPLKLKGKDLYLFNIYDIDERRYLNPLERRKIYSLMLEIQPKLKHVPILGIFYTFNNILTMQDMIKFADGKSLLNENIAREGLVFKSIELDEKTKDIISFKVISNSYLLKHED